jgi:hypothetical protein
MSESRDVAGFEMLMAACTLLQEGKDRVAPPPGSATQRQGVGVEVEEVAPAAQARAVTACLTEWRQVSPTAGQPSAF